VGTPRPTKQITYCSHCGAPRIGKLYSLRTVAGITDTTIASWRRRVLDREIPYMKVGKSVRISATALYEYMETIPSLTNEAQNILIDN
jgi:excisionase family DNA binding protein